MKIECLVITLIAACTACGGTVKAPALADGAPKCASSEAKTAPQSSSAHGGATAPMAEMAVTRDQLKRLTEVLLAANNSFAVGSKYPATFAADIAAARVDLNVATASAHLPQERLSEFVELAMQIRQIEELRKTIVDRVTRLEALPRGPGAAGEKQTIQYVVLVSLAHPYGLLAPLIQPISSSAADLRSLKLPKELSAEDPTTRMRVEVPTYQGGSITKPAGILVLPRSVQAMRTREAPDPSAELLADITRALNELWIGGTGRRLLAHVNEFVDAPAR